MRESRQNVAERRAAKRQARSTYKDIRAGIPSESRKVFEARITETLLDCMSYRYCEKILAYASLSHEVDTKAFCQRALADGRKLYLPKSYADGVMRFFAVSRWEDLQKGAFGVLEPCEKEEYVPSVQKADLCLVPGICFDVYGYRIGYGKGYYDRFLTKFTGVSLGLAYEACFCRELLPIEKRTDKPVDFIVTEKGINKRVCP